MQQGLNTAANSSFAFQGYWRIPRCFRWGILVSVPGRNTKHCQMSTITMTIDNWWIMNLWIYEFWRVIIRSRCWACQMVWHLSRGHSRSAWSDAVDDGGTVARSWWTPQLPAGSQVGIKHPAPGVVKKAQGFNCAICTACLWGLLVKIFRKCDGEILRCLKGFWRLGECHGVPFLP